MAYKLNHELKIETENSFLNFYLRVNQFLVQLKQKLVCSKNLKHYSN